MRSNLKLFDQILIKQVTFPQVSAGGKVQMSLHANLTTLLTLLKRFRVIAVSAAVVSGD